MLRFHEAKRSFEREYVSKVLSMCQGNVSMAAKLAGKDRKDFYDLMYRCGLTPDEFRIPRQAARAR